MVLACALNYAFWYNRWWEVNPKRVVDNTTWEQAHGQQGQVSSVSQKFVADDKGRSKRIRTSSIATARIS